MFILLYAVSSVLTFYKAKKKHHHALFQPHKCNHDICADFCAVSGQGCAVTYLEEEIVTKFLGTFKILCVKSQSHFYEIRCIAQFLTAATTSRDYYFSL